MKRLKYISIVLISAILISLVFSSCFADIGDTEPTTQEVTQKTIVQKPIEPKSTGYNYDSLKDSALEELYGLIHENAQNRIPSVELEVSDTLTEEQIRIVLDAYMYDHPEVFWLDTKFTYVVDSDGATSIYLFYIMDREELEEAKESFDNELKKVIAQAPKNASAYELEKFAYDYIIDNCEYDYTAAESEETLGNEDNAYGALIEKKAVCSGYSKTLQLLCNELGIDCVNIMGESEGEGHQWNCVKLEEEWYQVDVTWGDSESGELCKYDYFNLKDDQMYSDHTAWKIYTEVEDINEDGYNFFIPKCTSDKYNYYKYSCVTITDIYNSKEMVDFIATTAKERKKYVEFLVDESLDFSDTFDKLLNDGYLYEWIEDANDKNDDSPEIDPQCKAYKKDHLNVITVELIYL